MTTMTSATVSARGPTTGRGASTAATSPAMDEPPMAAAVVPTSEMLDLDRGQEHLGLRAQGRQRLRAQTVFFEQLLQPGPADGHDRDLRPGQRAIDEHQSDDHSNFSDDGRTPPRCPSCRTLPREASARPTKR